MSLCKKNPFELFCNIKIIPSVNMTLKEQMIAFTRLIIIIFLLMLIFMSNPISSFIFLFLSLLFIIILYYIQKKTMDKYKLENYENFYRTKSDSSKQIGQNRNQYASSLSQGKSFCMDKIILDPNNPNYISKNQLLAGPANPKTLIKPVIIPPIADLDYWRANNLINNSRINSESVYDTYLSGYQISNDTKCVKEYDIIEGFKNKNNDDSYVGVTDEFNPITSKCNPIQTIDRPIISPQPVTTIPFSYTIGMGNQGITEYQEKYNPNRYKNSVEGYVGSKCTIGMNELDTLGNKYIQKQIISPQPVTSNIFFERENFEYPYEKTGYNETNYISDNKSGLVNTIGSYNPKQVEQYNLSYNIESGNCETEDAMKQYNKNLFTQTIQPNVYTINNIIEPIDSNIGISFTQQFQPMTSYRDEDEDLIYTDYDPLTYEPSMVINTPDISVTESNIYDPRFTGYGTSYRAYTDNNVGQTRFYYDDVNSVRMPNYLVRSNIDFAKYADTYGPLNDSNKFGNKNTNYINTLAQDTFLRSSLKQRDDLMERLMRKRNNEMWQNRKYPKHTMG